MAADGLLDSVSALFAEDAGTRDPTFDISWSHRAGSQRFVDGATDPARLQLVACRPRHARDEIAASESGAASGSPDNSSPDNSSRGVIVGHLIGTLTEPTPMRPITIATLVFLYVRPAHRDNRVGERLVGEFRGWARAKGADQITVRASATNAAAIRFMSDTDSCLILSSSPWRHSWPRYAVGHDVSGTPANA